MSAMLASLPPHIIKSIIEYVIEPPDDFEDLIAEYVTESVFRSLLHICRSWREVSVPMMFSACDATVNSEPTFAYRAVGSNPCIISHIEPHYNSYVKDIRLKINYQSIANGTAMKQLRSQQQQLHFPNARHVEVKTVFFEEETAINNAVDADTAMTNISEFISFIHQTLPNISSINVCIADGFQEDGDIHSEALRALLDVFVGSKRLSTEIDIQETQRLAVVKSCQAYNMLTSLACRWDMENRLHIGKLIHTNARSLLTLKIRFHTCSDFRLLVVDSSGNPVVYPYLTRLVLSKDPDVVMETMPVIEHQAPFPRLEFLQITFDYPFSDDLPFRSNGSTLQFLCILLDHRIIRQLSNCGAFDKTRERVLDHLVIGSSNHGSLQTQNLKPIYRGFYSRVLPYVRYFFIHSSEDAYLMLQSLPATSVRYDNLQLLSMLHTRISFSQIVHILYTFPSLKTLICKYADMGDDFRDMSIQQVAAILRSKYSPLSTSLQCLYIYDFDSNSVNMMAASVLMLADQCPHLNMVKFPKHREDRALNVLLRLNQSRYPSEFRNSFLSKLDFALNQASKYTIIKIKHKLV
ncbi:hypothetical protein IWW36_001807 [Coemansia brasiliensis]|uniref:Uncharacterized protein n=1 Tax=Coemansia brasiliensis TaxID=2650707 RepID=A0A9W8I8D6_9FUNG|nr:hypothetical protein IWW36_001807 [Coemansia brasiliensis]